MQKTVLKVLKTRYFLHFVFWSTGQWGGGLIPPTPSGLTLLAVPARFTGYVWITQNCISLVIMVINRGGVEDTRLEAKAKAKDTKKIRGQGQGQGQPFRGQNLSRPRTGMLEAKAKDQGHRRKCSPKKKSSKIFFRRSPIRWRTQNLLG